MIQVMVIVISYQVERFVTQWGYTYLVFSQLQEYKENWNICKNYEIR